MAIASAFKLRHLPHAPPFKTRFWIYCVAAYLMPVIVQLVLPDDPGSTDELVWLVTIAPAFLLSLHFGLRGSLVGLLAGTGLFITVQLILALSLNPDDWRVTVPIYIAYGTLTITVGWLSEELHVYYGRSLKNERMASIGELAVTVQHEINNALMTIITETDFLLAGSSLSESQQAAVRNIHESGKRITQTVEKITGLVTAPTTTYLDDVRMIDLDKAERRDRSHLIY